MTKWKIYNEDAVEWAKNYSKAKFHALLTDAPYHLTSITKRFGKNGSAPAKFGKDGAFQRASKGFMGSTWDGGDLAFRPETWQAFGNVLHDGAFGMAFSASRNWHRMAVAIEDAGFILHPTIFLWAYGQGFPKATRVKGEEEFDGHRYGLQALKPAVEPIIVFQKPYSGKPVENIVHTGAGALNIDGGRISTQEVLSVGSNNRSNGAVNYGMKDNREVIKINRFKNGAKPWGNARGEEYDTESTQQGRWPSNLILTEESAERLDAQGGETSGKRSPRGGTSPNPMSWGDVRTDGENMAGYDDKGGVSRFFYQVSTQLDEADPAYYKGKANVSEREVGLIGHILCSSHDDLEVFHVDDLLTSTQHYKLNDRGEKVWSNCRRNVHPTVKPIDLARYLATLLLPPVEYAPRRIFVPFSGVASEMIGCGLVGWEHVVGVEFDTENDYVDIAEKRLEYHLK